MGATGAAQKTYMVRLEAATTSGPNASGAGLAAMTDAAIRAAYTAVEALLGAMKGLDAKLPSVKLTGAN